MDWITFVLFVFAMVVLCGVLLWVLERIGDDDEPPDDPLGIDDEYAFT